MPYLPHKLLQRRKAAPQARFLGAHPNLEVTLLVSRAIQRHAQEVDGLRAFSTAFACVSLREPTKLNQLGFGRLKSEAELSQPKAQRVLDTDGVRSILEADHKGVVTSSTRSIRTPSSGIPGGARVSLRSSPRTLRRTL